MFKCLIFTATNGNIITILKYHCSCNVRSFYLHTLSNIYFICKSIQLYKYTCLDSLGNKTYSSRNYYNLFFLENAEIVKMTSFGHWAKVGATNNFGIILNNNNLHCNKFYIANRISARDSTKKILMRLQFISINYNSAVYFEFPIFY